MSELGTPANTAEDNEMKGIESARVLQRAGENIATLSIVVGGQNLMFVLERAKLLRLLESGFEALRRQED